MSKPFFITTPIYYINSTPTVGHAYTQIAADARARFERLRGREVYFLTGTDENAIKVSRVAQEQGRDPLEFCDELAAAFREVWDKLQISYDDFIRTTEPRHRVPVQKVVQHLWDASHLKLDTYSGWYSVPDETFFRSEETEERDGAHYIKNPSEDQSKAPLEWVEETGHFFKLTEFGPRLLELYERKPEMLRPQTRRNEVLSFIGNGLHDTSISRVQDWGIPLPPDVPESANHVVYVWFPDALLNYATAPGYLSDDPIKARKFAEIWPPDLQLMSKDIFTRFHSVLWPSLLMALDLEQPRELFGHGFWTVNGRKISKRDPETIIEPIAFAQQIADAANCDFEIGVDALRYYCLREVTFGVDGDFSTDGCFARYNADLANGLGNLLQRALVMISKYFDGVLPSSTKELGLKSELPARLEAVAAGYETLNFSGVLSEVWEVVGRANKLIEDEKPWAKVKDGRLDEVAALLHELLAVLRWVCVCVSPVMPQSANRIWRALGLVDEMKWDSALESFPENHRFAPAQIIFPRADATKFARANSSNMNTNPTETVAPTAPAPVVDETPNQSGANLITIDDFAKVELRVGRVIEAERVPKADKLLRLQVEMGTETRQVLAGIAQFYAPEEIVGKTVVVVANLAPRTLRGYESRGMLLAASAGDKLSLVTTLGEMEAGALVR